MVQMFKGDDRELQMYRVANAPCVAIGLALDQFYEDIYSCVPLGEFLYDEGRVPLANAIKREVFVKCFKQLLDAFAVAGTFESYITVLKKVFGEDVLIDFIAQGGSGLVEYAFEYDDDEFIVDHDGDILFFGEPFGPGQLIINVETANLTEFTASAREIVSNAYVLDDIVTTDGDNLTFSAITGIETEAELKELLFVLAPAGIFTQVNLTIL